ncbi:hypothetical protein GIB67_013353 [Kingdonia uniflora]|uniref:glycerophosphodiester phosphodiesterase n=1 Tax=Kingdonia uniflora TaxID=39325 RepID=A0A7J7LR24_9MAGN|nr:hypothetical protein GIB67_013353 [Kingdonia uniflora]
MPTFHGFLYVLVVVGVLHSAVIIVSAQRSSNRTSPWQTLSGDAPLVLARGGFSGIFPAYSESAYTLASLLSLPNVVFWCNVQLTKDGAGICLSDLLLNNNTNIEQVRVNDSKTYSVNGVPTTGWFSIDYTLADLQANFTLIQGLFNRPPYLDGAAILSVENVGGPLKPPSFWLNIQHDAFFTQHNLSMRSYVLSVSRRVIVNYVSSPEVGFLRSIAARFKGSKTKLVFSFPIAVDTEPTTNQSYSSLLKNLTFIKTFASGIIVPKSYIWPVNIGLYLQPHTSLVSDAHKEGLEVFASEFANDIPFSYNYSFDPKVEYLSFVDNGDFSVDGVLSDFPMTPSLAIDCFSHMSKNSSRTGTLKVISHNGASGIYPGSTDLAYDQAVEDGVDYIDCSVQMTSDGIPVCLSSINLLDYTTVAQSPFSSLTLTIPELKTGIFTFNLAWKDIQTLKPAISNPSKAYALFRYPAHKNDGSFMSLADFLTFAKSKTLSGVLISIENAAYLAEKQGLDITGAVLDTLSKSGYDNQTSQKVIIQSTDKAVLTKFKEQTKYNLMYMVGEDIGGADNSSIGDIKSFANSVAISKASVYTDDSLFLTGATNIVTKLHSANLTVYVYLFRNEFDSIAYDFFADPVADINSYVLGVGIDGLITDYPGTAVTYTRNQCLKRAVTPTYMRPIGPGQLLQAITSLPPADAPSPILTDGDVSEPPLPAVSKQGQLDNVPAATPSSPPNGHPRNAVCIFLSSLSIILASIFMF